MKMVENNKLELTEHETELYDRQIRLWGLESQKRLRAARILFNGINGLGAEIVKNIVLAGVKSVTLLDCKNVAESDFASQFLVTGSSLGSNRAEASLSRAQVLNPMVEIITDKGNLSEKDDEYFENFDVVCILEANTAELIRIDNICRDKKIKFFAADLWGMFGYSFADLQDHSYVEDVVKYKMPSDSDSKKRETVTSTVKRNVSFPSYQKSLEFDYSSPKYLRKVKRTGPSLIILRILQKYRDLNQADPSYMNREEEMGKLLKIRDELSSAAIVPDSVFTHIFSQISPAAAIVGGAVAHEIIKTVSEKEAPHCNMFFFDPDNSGFVEAVGVE